MRKQRVIIFTEYHHKFDNVLAAKKAGFRAVLITKKKTSETKKLFNGIFEVDFDNKLELDKIFPIIRSKYNVRAVVSNYEHFVVQRSYIAEKLSVPCTSVFSACCTRNKILQRHALSVMPENIDWNQVSTLSEAEKAFQKFQKSGAFLKAVSGIKSRCVYSLNSLSDVKKAWKYFEKSRQSLDESLNKDFDSLDFRFRYPDPNKIALIEKREQGQQVSILSFVGSHRIWHAPSMCDIYTAKDIGRNDSFLAFRILPSKYSIEIITEAQIVTETAIRILGLQYCAIHIEFIISPEGKMKIIEIASRIGGYRSAMYKTAYDISIPDLFIQVVTGKAIQERKNKQNYVSLLEIFPTKEGIFEKLEHEEKLKSSEISNICWRIKKGDKVGLAKNGYPPILSFLIQGNTYEEIYEKSLKYQKELKVILK